MRDLLGDIRYAARTLVRQPGFTLVAILTLGIGIGANSSIFSIVDALFLRPLPFHEPSRLVAVEPWNGSWGGAGLADFLDWRQQNTVFGGMALSQGGGMILSADSLGAAGEPEPVEGAEVTASFFSVLGVKPVRGRTFNDGEDLPGNANVVVLSYQFWQQRLGGRDDVIGKKLTSQAGSYTIIGVMPFWFRWSENGAAQLWTPLEFEPRARHSRTQHQYGTIARLRPGVTVEAAREQMKAIAARLEREYPASNKGWTVRVFPLQRAIAGDARPVALLMNAIVGFVLLIVCANLASLSLSLAASRSRDLAVRASLGAGRWRIARELLARSMLLSLAGGALGVVVALWGVEAARPLAAEAALPFDLRVDARVLAFTVVLSLATGILFGLAPALRSARPNLIDALKSTGAGAGTGRRRNRLLKSLVAGELALAVALLAVSGVLIESLTRMLAADLGFRSDHLLTMHIHVPFSQYSEPGQQLAFSRELVERVRGVRGVAALGLVSHLPLAGSYSGGGFSIEGRPAPARWDEMPAQYVTATPGYFRAMGIPILRGRNFGPEDRLGAPKVVIITETIANKYWPGADPLGARIVIRREPLTIIGVCGRVRHNGPAKEFEPQIYMPNSQEPSNSAFLVARTLADPGTLARPLRSVIRQLDKNAVVTRVRSMGAAVQQATRRPKLVAVVATSLAVFAAVLAAIGLYGVVSHVVAQRTHEYGVRIALGADRGDIARLVLGQGARLTAAGVAIGLTAAAASVRLLSSIVYGVRGFETGVFLSVAALLACVALLASYLPARRATRVDPVDALRAE